MEAVGVGRRAVAIIIDAVILFPVGYVIALLYRGQRLGDMAAHTLVVKVQP